MDAAAAQTAVAAGSSLGEPAVTAALVALAIGLSEIIKQLVSWFGRRVTGDDDDDSTSTRASMVAMAASMARVVEAQERLAKQLASLDERFEAHDKQDAINFARVGDGLARVEVVANENKRNLLEAARDHDTQLGKLEAIERKQDDHDRRAAAGH